MTIMDNGDKKKNGNATEKSINEVLTSLGLAFEEQKYSEGFAAYFANTDFFVDNKLWIHATGDLFGGGLQVDRLEHLYLMFKNGAWKPGEVCYVVERIYPPASKLKKPTERQVRVAKAIDELVENKMLFSVDSLTEYLKEV